MTTKVTAEAVLRQFQARHPLPIDYDHKGYCWGGIETRATSEAFGKPKDHKGYCWGGIETLISTDTFLPLATTKVTAEAVLRLVRSMDTVFPYDHKGYCWGGIETVFS